MNILITKFIRQRAFMREVIKNKGASFRECPFIDFEYIPPKEFPETEWLFFTSRNSIISFPEHFWQLQSKKYKFGVTGQGTAEQLKEKLVSPDFIGAGNKPTPEIAREFYDAQKPASVWFPVSDISNKTFQSQADEDVSIVETIAYHTLIKPFALQKTYDWYAFTSPSNVEGFFELNELPDGAKVMAIGQQTKKKLRSYTNQEVYLPNESTEYSILDFFNEI